MKLRNKKTRKVFDAIVREKSDDDKKYSIIVCDLQKYKKVSEPLLILGEYDSLAKLYEEWEDYKPTEPLIKDEKIRKAVRAWAEANGVDRVTLGQVNGDELVKKSPMTAFGCHISFEGNLGLERGRNYTIEELCGERRKNEILQT